MVNFEPADLPWNIKQVTMSNTGLKGDKKSEECASFCLIRRAVRKSEWKSQRVLMKLKQPAGPDAFMEIICI